MLCETKVGDKVSGRYIDWRETINERVENISFKEMETILWDVQKGNGDYNMGWREYDFAGNCCIVLNGFFFSLVYEYITCLKNFKTRIMYLLIWDE